MAIDLSKLSAKELFELAQKKEQEELQAAERQGKLDELKGKREAMIGEHKSVLSLTDKKIRDMQEQREKLIRDQEAALAALDAEIKALGGTAPKSVGSSATADPARLKSVIRQIMNKRPYISASLLKEKLAAYDMVPADFSRELEQWVKDGWFEKKGQGNFSLGKRI